MTILTVREMPSGTGIDALQAPVIPGNGEADRTVVLSSKQITAFLAQANVEPEATVEPVDYTPVPFRCGSAPFDAVRIHLVPKAGGGKTSGGGPAVAVAVSLATIAVAFQVLAYQSDSGPGPAFQPASGLVVSTDNPCDIDPSKCAMRVVPADFSVTSLGTALGQAAIVGVAP